MDKRIFDELEGIYTALKLLRGADRPVKNPGEYMIVFNFPGGNAMLFYQGFNLQYRITYFKNKAASEYGQSIHYDEQINMINKIKKIM
ncbi:hypothetical protein D3C85_1440730 [compost metagenome]